MKINHFLFSFLQVCAQELSNATEFTAKAAAAAAAAASAAAAAEVAVTPPACKCASRESEKTLLQEKENEISSLHRELRAALTDLESSRRNAEQTDFQERSNATRVQKYSQTDNYNHVGLIVTICTTIALGTVCIVELRLLQLCWDKINVCLSVIAFSMPVNVSQARSCMSNLVKDELNRWKREKGWFSVQIRRFCFFPTPARNDLMHVDIDRVLNSNIVRYLQRGASRDRESQMIEMTQTKQSTSDAFSPRRLNEHCAVRYQRRHSICTTDGQSSTTDLIKFEIEEDD